MLSLDEIKAEVDRRAALIDAAGHPALPAYGRTDFEAQPCVEIDERGFHLVVRERGEELERVTTGDLDELLYRIFAGVTFSMAVDHEVRHRDLRRDGRRLMFARQVELLRRLSSAWAAREEEDHARILRERPFVDDVHRRADYTVQLRNSGIAPETAWQRACERYPLPEG